MRLTAILIGFIFGTLTMVYSTPALDVLIGGIAVVAAIATMLHPRAGMVGFLVTVGFAMLGLVQDWAFLVYVLLFGLAALLAWRSAERNRQRAEREARMDRYVRSQLGE